MTTFLAFKDLTRIASVSGEANGFTVTRQESGLIVVGKERGHVTMKEGDRLGCDRGSIWLIQNPETYPDPVRRFIASQRLSQRLVKQSAVVKYRPAVEERYIAGEFTETTGDNGESMIFNADLVVLVERADSFPIFLVSITVNSIFPYGQRELLLPWIEETVITQDYWEMHSERMKYAYYLARCICIKSGICWDRQVLYQKGSSFQDFDGILYTIHAYRDMHRPFGLQTSWIPQICKMQNGVAYPLDLAGSLHNGLLNRWATRCNAMDTCSFCGTPLASRSKNLYCPQCKTK